MAAYKYLSIIGVCLTLCSCGSDHWRDKATANERTASAQVGGFSDDDRRLYHQGLQHIYNAHQRVGSFTVGQVIDQERQRETNRDGARENEKAAVAKANQERLDAKARANDKRLDAIATANLKSSIKLSPSLYRGAIMDGGNCGIRIDGDYYENESDQDKSLIKQTAVTMCAASYTELGGNDSRKLPEGGLHIRVYDLADHIVYSDIAQAGADPPAAHVQQHHLANADPHSAYKVLQHWDIPCSDKGGFGEKVMALSHRQSDLELVYKRWMAEHTLDKGQCIAFMAFASQASFDAAEHLSQYTDAQLETIPSGLSYDNNPNTGYEGWNIGGEHEHVLHPASN